MEKLDTPDLCARLDTMKRLCDQLELAQDHPEQYQVLLQKIRVEADVLRDTVCSSRTMEAATEPSASSPPRDPRR